MEVVLSHDHQQQIKVELGARRPYCVDYKTKISAKPALSTVYMYTLIEMLKYGNVDTYDVRVCALCT